MTRDIFDHEAGTLDFIIYAVLATLGLERDSLSTADCYIDSMDNRAARNAERFLTHFGPRKIQAIKEIRTISGLGLKDAKEAYEQIVETYLFDTENDEITREDWIKAVNLGLTIESCATWIAHQENHRR